MFSRTENPDRPGTAFAIHERPDDEYTLKDLAHAALQQGVLGGFRHDDLVRFAVDHELPPALMNVGAFLIFPDRQSPLLKQVHSGIHVPGDVGHQIFTGDAHEIVAHVIHIVLYGIGAVPQTHVLVNRGKPHRHGAGPVNRGFIDQRYLQAVLLGPEGSFDRRSASGHAAA